MKLLATAAAATIVTSALLASDQWTAPLHAQQPTGAVRGETLFKQRCAMCHAVSGKGGKLGPDLARVAGRKAGSAPYAYSPAMKGSKIVWNAATLDKYLTAPAKAVPGTKMIVAVPKPEDRKALIDYLAAQK